MVYDTFFGITCPVRRQGSSNWQAGSYFFPVQEKKHQNFKKSTVFTVFLFIYLKKAMFLFCLKKKQKKLAKKPTLASHPRPGPPPNKRGLEGATVLPGGALGGGGLLRAARVPRRPPRPV